MKKKIYSLIMGICLFFAGVFSFSGCSLVSTESSPATSAVVMKIGDTNVTKNDLINAFYTYYQNNNSYFAYYDEETIEESFYTWFTVKTMVEELSFKALYDAETNKNGYIYYTNEDADTVWGNVEEYFYSQVSAYEKALYAADGVKEEDYPSWLHDHDDSDEATTGFTYYTSPVSKIEFKDRSQDVAIKLSKEKVYEKVAGLKKYLFQYSESDDHDDHEHTEMIDIVDDDLKLRNQAYANYIQSLVSNAKANGVSTKVDDVLKAEVLRIYEAYYESQIGVIFQNYYIQDHLLKEDKTTLSDRTVVAKFLDKYYTEMQANKLQDGYVKTMESSEGASLVLYHYQGRNYYFSVQHILVSFTDYVLEQVQALEGYGVTNSGEAITNKYIADREAIATNGISAILTKVNKDAEKGTLISVGEYYYFDETKKESKADNYGYIKLTTSEYNSTTKKYEVKTSTSYTNSEGKEITYESDEAVLMATVADVTKAYELNYTIWQEMAEQVFKETKTIEEIIGATIGDDTETGRYKEIEYVLKVVENMRENEATLEEVNAKVASLLFVELEWIYSGDTLGNEISNKIGYVVSSKDDNNMNWVVDFAVGARAMLEEYDAKILANEDVTTFIKPVLTDYGYHIMKIENVYDESSIVDMASVGADYSLEHNSDYVKEVTSLLKKTYLCSASNQTLYEYFYDEAYNTLVGTESASGTYFLALEYDWLSQYYDDNKIEVTQKVGYQELLGSIS